jgi:hypothetical protein
LELLKDEELVTILREHDDEQWRPEVFEIVGAILQQRGVSPSEEYSEPTKADACFDETGNLDLVTLAEYIQPIDAQTDRLALEAKGLKVWILNENVQLWGPIIPGSKLQVRAEDLAFAKAILESESVPSSDLPPEIAEPPCPKCGSRRVTEAAEIPDALTDPTDSSTKTTWVYHCASCGHRWSES